VKKCEEKMPSVFVKRRRNEEADYSQPVKRNTMRSYCEERETTAILQLYCEAEAVSL